MDQVEAMKVARSAIWEMIRQADREGEFDAKGYWQEAMAAFEGMIEEAERVAPNSSQAGEAQDPDIVYRAFHQACEREGFLDVRIGTMHKAFGGDLEALREFLLTEVREGRAVAFKGDWSTSGAHDRAAALWIDGEPHLRIRLQPEGPPAGPSEVGSSR